MSSCFPDGNISQAGTVPDDLNVGGLSVDFSAARYSVHQKFCQILWRMFAGNRVTLPRISLTKS